MKNLLKKRFVCILAAQIRKADNTLTRRDAMKTAWLIINKGNGEYTLVTFTKTDGTECRRVVSENWTKYAPPTGTGKPKPAGLELFADLGKFIGGQRCIISTYNVIARERLNA